MGELSGRRGSDGEKEKEMRSHGGRSREQEMSCRRPTAAPRHRESKRRRILEEEVVEEGGRHGPLPACMVKWSWCEEEAEGGGRPGGDTGKG